LKFNIDNPFISSLNSTAVRSWNPTIDPKVAVERVIFPTMTSGAQSGDSISAPGTGTWLLSNQITPKFSSIPGDIGNTSITIEMITNQGVVNQ
jgi:hypothetical protein